MTTLQIVLVSIAGGLVVLAVALIPVWMLLFQLHFGRKTMRRIAGERKGQLIEGGCCDIPAIAFRHGQSKFHLQFKVLKSNKTRRMLILTAPWPDDSRITIYRETFWTRAKSFLGLEDIQIGDSDFDNQYVLQSNRPARLPAILHPPARNLLMRIGFRDFGPSLNINTAAGRITMSMESRSWRYLLVDSQISDFLELYDHLVQGIAPKGIQSSAKWSPIERDGICLVCGVGIEGRRVQCRRCQTPHHEECWDYVGSCSIFGCGCRDAVRSG